MFRFTTTAIETCKNTKRDLKNKKNAAGLISMAFRPLDPGGDIAAQCLCQPPAGHV
jgi:hypothetical protein